MKQNATKHNKKNKTRLHDIRNKSVSEWISKKKIKLPESRNAILII